jgi:integrase
MTPESKVPKHGTFHRSGSIPDETERVLAQIGDANRPLATRIVRQMENRGLAPATAYTMANALRHADRCLAKSFAEASVEDLMGMVQSLRAYFKSGETLFTNLTNIRTAWKDLLDVEKLPRQVHRALQVKRPKYVPKGRLVTDEMFHLLLQEASREPGEHLGLPKRILGIALLWMLWDTGLRADELLSLNVGDVEFTHQGGAIIRMREEAPHLGHGRLKKGPRDVVFVEAVGPLKAMLAMHPDGTDLRAPLFPSFGRSGGGRLRYGPLHRFVRKVASRSGVDAMTSREKVVTPHDFRHTSATRDGRRQRTAQFMETKYGWTAGSRMTSHYVHLGTDDMMAIALRDAGIDPLGYAAPVDAADPAELMAEAMRLVQERRQLAQTRTKKPGEHRLR